MNRKNKQKILLILEIIILLVGIAYFISSLFILKENKIFHIINSFLICSIVILYLIDSLDKDKNIYKILITLAIGLLVCFNFINDFNILSTKEITIQNFTNTSLNSLLDWAKTNNIVVEQTYEYSDNVKEFDIISQDVLPGTELSKISSIKIVVSLGPNYDKLVIIPDMSGRTLDELLNIKNELFLNNVIIDFEINKDIPKNTVISQSIKGQYKRNTQVNFTVSLGGELTPTTMIDLKGKSLFDATLWLKQNGIKYKLNYEFNNDIKRDFIISHDILEGTTVSDKDTVNLIVSKGKSIIVPNLLSMKSDDVVKWIADNNLKIEFSDRYDVTVPLGTIISANYKENDQIEVGTLIKIVTSKGQLKFPTFSSLSDFRKWATTYSIGYSEEYQMNDSISKGSIIKFSVNTGDVIDINQQIVVYVSNGSPVTVPNFYGMSRDNVTSTCNNVGLICTFYDAGYTDKNADIAVTQNMRASSTVVSGTYVSVGLSKGIAQTFTVRINQSSIQSCIGDANCTINYLRTLFQNNYPGVEVNFSIQASETFQFAGNIHENSAIKDGSSVTQGRSYVITVTK